MKKIILVFVSLIFLFLFFSKSLSFDHCDQCHIRIGEMEKWSKEKMIFLGNVVEVYLRNPDIFSDIPIACIYIINREEILAYSYLYRNELFLFCFNEENNCFEKNEVIPEEEYVKNDLIKALGWIFI